MRKKAIIIVVGRTGCGKSVMTAETAEKLGLRIVRPYMVGNPEESNNEVHYLTQEQYDAIPDCAVAYKNDRLCITYGTSLRDGDFIFADPYMSKELHEQLGKKYHLVDFYIYTDEKLRRSRSSDPDFGKKNREEEQEYSDYETNHGYDILLYNNWHLGYAVDNMVSYAKIVMQYRILELEENGRPDGSEDVMYIAPEGEPSPETDPPAGGPFTEEPPAEAESSAEADDAPAEDTDLPADDSLGEASVKAGLPSDDDLPDEDDADLTENKTDPPADEEEAELPVKADSEDDGFYLDDDDEDDDFDLEDDEPDSEEVPRPNLVIPITDIFGLGDEDDEDDGFTVEAGPDGDEDADQNEDDSFSLDDPEDEDPAEPVTAEPFEPEPSEPEPVEPEPAGDNTSPASADDDWFSVDDGFIFTLS